MFSTSDSTYLSQNEWYITYEKIRTAFDWDILGYSSEERPLLYKKLGNGPRSICIWAGMHGNETTGIFMILGLVELFQKKQLDLAEFTLHVLPVANPDAYVRYSRRNGIGIDLNRDFRAFQTIESAKLIGWIKMHGPELCFNLHDQRTIFHTDGIPAFTSLLVPSAEKSRAVTPLRKKTMVRLSNALVSMNTDLAGVGRYTDEFYPTAIGDYLMANGLPNILIESGVAVGDFNRKKARAFGLNLILKTLNAGYEGGSEPYDALPLNENGLLELVFTNVLYAHMRVDVAIKRIQYVNGHAMGLLYVVDDLGDLASRPRMKEVDGTSIGLTQPLQIDKPVTGVFGDYLFEEGQLISQG